MTLYLDVLLLENFIVNRFLLEITAQTIRVSINRLYINLAALIGSLYILIILQDSLNYLKSFPVKFFIALIMILITFRRKDVMFNLKTFVLFILYSMVLAGLCVFIELNSVKDLDSNMIIYDFSYKKLILSFMIMYVILRRVVLFIKDRQSLQSYIFDLEIVLNNNSQRIKAFLDTGNELVEPVTGYPVIIVERNIFKETNFKSEEMFYIPYSVINGYSGKLQAIKAGKIKVNINGCFEDREALIAFCDNKLSQSGDYNALLSRGII
ncbi:MAG: sigma-E processing peptidase SpoIIGA [Clostridium lundense]|nr:sigma-E processing peptidase SpoIIGA [Clostridium lundense]